VFGSPWFCAFISLLLILHAAYYMRPCPISSLLCPFATTFCTWFLTLYEHFDGMPFSLRAYARTLLRHLYCLRSFTWLFWDGKTDDSHPAA